MQSSSSLLLLSDRLLPEMVIPFSVISMGQIGMFIYLLRSVIIIGHMKLYSCVQIVSIK